jgi:uncharacterized membrane protein YdbT with pleckstrin-like domain
MVPVAPIITGITFVVVVVVVIIIIIVVVVYNIILAKTLRQQFALKGIRRQDTSLKYQIFVE